MLELKNIVKVYASSGETVTALKGISLRFRDSEFVSILGPSGCGKTTLLNIIGGLDQYTEGDLVINGTSTKQYGDREWDAYRNHSIGFVFQSYNLIPHQTVLANVELALTLSGVSKKERRQRAKDALALVGLGDQLKKKPAQMSGGQMQRVAIARAIVNNPDIVLADEPTGALDTETSVQVMDILKEISKDRLVIMVTHNPDLAEKYSTRIVRMLDGVITADSAPVSDEEAAAVPAKAPKSKKREKKPSMSFATSFGLSLKNLFTKKGRTMLTSFAGSIGIIGIALIYAVSQGTTYFINSVQEETLTAYPLTIESQTVDLGALINTFVGRAESEESHGDDAVYQKSMIYEFVSSLSALEAQENDLKAFKAYIENQRADENSLLHSALSGVQYTYDVDLMVYTKNADGEIILSDMRTLMQKILSKYYGGTFSSGSSTTPSMMRGYSTLWRELVPGDNGRLLSPVTKKQYDLLYGNWPTRYDEVVVFLDEKNELSDLTLYALGLKSEDEISAIITAAKDGEKPTSQTVPISYAELCSRDFRVVLQADCWTYDEASKAYTDLRSTQTGLSYLYDNALSLRVVGVAKPNESAISSGGSGSIGYTYKLTEYIIENADDTAMVKAQKETPDTDIFTGKLFKSGGENMSDAQKADFFKNHAASLNENEKAMLYFKVASIPPEGAAEKYAADSLADMSREEMEKSAATAMSAQTGMSEDAVAEYLSAMSDEDLSAIMAGILRESYKAQYAATAGRSLIGKTPSELAAALDAELDSATERNLARYYDQALQFSDSTYEDNLIKLGAVDIDSPSTINLYASTFENKDNIEEAITQYNDKTDELHRIKYTDYVGLMMSSITTIINAITYVLVAFVAVSLVVSSIMIGVITLISVQERTKEIGILRAIGASKKNVSRMFNAETMIIGFSAGTLGVLITYLLCIPINLLLHALTGLPNLNAVLPLSTAVILVAISILLTLVAGVIPSRSAAKKDPVVALRTE